MGETWKVSSGSWLGKKRVATSTPRLAVAGVSDWSTGL